MPYSCWAFVSSGTPHKEWARPSFGPWTRWARQALSPIFILFNKYIMSIFFKLEFEGNFLNICHIYCFFFFFLELQKSICWTQLNSHIQMFKSQNVGLETGPWGVARIFNLGEPNYMLVH